MDTRRRPQIPKLMGEKINIVHIEQEAVNFFPLPSVLLHKEGSWPSDLAMHI